MTEQEHQPARPEHDGNGERIRAIVCDDDAMTRRVIRDALEASGVIVIAETPGGREALELTIHYRPDVLLTDVLMPGMDGLETTRRVMERAPDVRVLMLTVSADPDLGMAGLRAGAAGFLSKSIEPDVLADRVKGVARGEAAVSERVLLKLIERLRSMPEGGLGVRPVRSALTSREWEVLDQLCAGASVEDIADEFVLSSETVRSHVKSILRKLDVHSQAEAVACAERIRSLLAIGSATR